MSIKSAFCFILIFVLLLTVFTLSALAVTEFPAVPVVAQFPQYGGLNVGSGTYGTNYVGTTSQTEAHLFYVQSGSTYELYAVSVNSDSILCYNGYQNTTRSLQYNNASLGLWYYSLLGGISTPNSSIPSFANVNSGLAAYRDFLDYVPVDPVSFQYSLPPGNVAYIEMGSSSAIKLSMDFPELSNSFGTPFSKANSAYALVDSLPSVGSAVASGTVIPWAKSGRLNLIGQTSEASFGPVGPIATRYVAVINPSYYDHVLVTGTYRQNPPIQIEALNVLSIQVYPLQSDFTFNNDTGQVTTSIAGDAYTGDVDSETGNIYWTDPDGGSSAPPLGGNNLPEAGNSIFDTLRNIASDFSEFLKGPVSAIRVVVQSIRDFMGSFTQLYTWLPSPVYNLITSALMIALTIGVIKIFV